MSKKPATKPRLVPMSLEAHQEVLATHETMVLDLKSRQDQICAKQEAVLARVSSQQDCFTAGFRDLQIRQNDLSASIATLTNNFNQLMANYLPPAPQASSAVSPNIPSNVSPSVIREPKLQLPLRYSGELGRCRGFLSQCLIFFKSQPTRYSSEEARVAFILSLLTGSALAWAEPLIRTNSQVISSSEHLMEEMAQVFDHDVSGCEAANKLIQLRQGSQSVAEFSITFRALAGEAGWQGGPLISLFQNALSDPVQDALVMLDPPATLDALISTAIRTDNRIRERERHKTKKKCTNNSGDLIRPEISV